MRRKGLHKHFVMCLQQSDRSVRIFEQASATHITFFKSNPQLFAVSSKNGEVISSHNYSTKVLLKQLSALLQVLFHANFKHRVHACVVEG